MLAAQVAQEPGDTARPRRASPGVRAALSLGVFEVAAVLLKPGSVRLDGFSQCLCSKVRLNVGRDVAPGPLRAAVQVGGDARVYRQRHPLFHIQDDTGACE